MKINPDRTVTLEANSQPCRRCYGRGTTVVTQPCPTDGRGPRGGKDGCRTCHGTMRHYDLAVTEVCVKCHGLDPRNHEDETLYDHLEISAFADLVAWRVVDATDTRFTELGLCVGARGTIVTVGDYGDHLSLTDDELVAHVRSSQSPSSTQGVVVVREDDMRLCDAVVIVRRRNGYAVMPVWDQPVSVAA